MKKIILVVDDDPLIIRLYKKLFAKHGCEAIGASTGKEAKQLLNGQKFDMAILDIQLPDLSGFDLLNIIRTNPKLKNMKVVMFSGFTAKPEIQKKCKELGVECITKGAGSPTQLVNEMVQVLDSE